MIPPRYAELAGKTLVREEQLSIAPVAANDRARAIGAIEAALVAKAKKKQRVRFALGTVAAAAAAALVTIGALAARDMSRVAVNAAPVTSTPAITVAPPVVVGQSGDVVVVSSAGTTSTPGEGATVARGSRLIARPGGHAILAFATGTRLTVADGGDVSIIDDGLAQVFALGAGSVRADVAKLAGGQRFLVRTPDAEVEARGTSFRVSLVPAAAACGNGTITRVVVYEGAVVVRRGSTQDQVASGEEWPRGCVAALTPAPVSADDGAKPSLVAPAARAPDVDTSAGGGSSLARQNDLFAQAIAQKSSGRAAAAVATFERLLATYPQSPLTEAALAERMKLLATIDRARAVASAKQYLARYPGGFARADAEAIVAGSR